MIIAYLIPSIITMLACGRFAGASSLSHGAHVWSSPAVMQDATVDEKMKIDIGMVVSVNLFLINN